MAYWCSAFRTSGLFLILCLCVSASETNIPWIFSFRVIGETCSNDLCEYKFGISGSNLENSWCCLTRKPASRGSACDRVLKSQFQLKKTGELDVYETALPYLRGKYYICLKTSNGWVHQGNEVNFEHDNYVTSQLNKSRLVCVLIIYTSAHLVFVIMRKSLSVTKYIWL